MADRREEDLQLDVDKAQQQVSQKLGISEQNVQEAEQKVQEQIQAMKNVASFQGSGIEIAQQNSLAVLGVQYLIASFLSMILVLLGPIGSILTWIPFLDKLTIILFLIVLLLVEFAPTSINQKPSNFIIFIVHSVTKILLLVFTSLWWEPLRCELIQLLFAIIVAYILYMIKAAISSKTDINLSVKGNFFSLLFVAVGIGAFLSLLTRQNLIYMIIISAVGVGYAYYLMWALQRYPEHQFMTENSNDFYIGAAQLDADLILFCKLIAFHCFSKKEQEPQQLPQEDEKEQI